MVTLFQSLTFRLLGFACPRGVLSRIGKPRVYSCFEFFAVLCLGVHLAGLPRRSSDVPIYRNRNKDGSIKNNKLCETNPIFGKPKMNLTHYSTNRYNNNSGLLTMQKQSQNEPKRTQFYPLLGQGIYKNRCDRRSLSPANIVPSAPVVILSN